MLRRVCELPPINTCVAKGAVLMIPSKLLSLKRRNGKGKIFVRGKFLDFPLHELQLMPVRIGVNSHLHIDLLKHLLNLI